MKNCSPLVSSSDTLTVSLNGCHCRVADIHSHLIFVNVPFALTTDMYCEIGFAQHLMDVEEEMDEDIELPITVPANTDTNRSVKMFFHELEVRVSCTRRGLATLTCVSFCNVHVRVCANKVAELGYMFNLGCMCKVIGVTVTVL